MNLQQFLLILRARWKVLLAVALATVLVTTLASLLMAKSYTANASVVVDFKSTDLVGGMMLPTQIMPGYLATQIDILTSQKVALKVVRRLRLTESSAIKAQFQEATGGAGTIEVWLADLLSKKLDVKPARESSVINIEFTATDPRFAAAVANAFAQSYIDATLELRVEPAKQTAAWFDSQMKTLRDNLEGAQAKLSRYQRETGIIATDERLDVENARLSELSTQLVSVQGVSSESQNRERKAKELVAKGAAADELAEVLNQPVIISLKSDLARLEAKLQEAASQLGRNHPDYQQIDAQIRELQKKLVAETGNVTKGLTNTNTVNQRREAEVRAALEAQKHKVLQLKQQRDEINVQMREVEGAQKAFDVAMARYSQTSLEGQANQTNIAVLNPAVEPIKHSSPKIALNIALAVVLGSMLGLGAALALESIDRRVRSASDLRTLIDLPLLGVVVRDRAPKAGMRRLARPRLTLPGAGATATQ